MKLILVAFCSSLVITAAHAQSPLADGRAATDGAPQSAAGPSHPLSLSGRVLDASGGAIRGAAITLRHAGTGTERVTSSDADGAFTVRGLREGAYGLTVAAAGFASTRRDLSVPAGDLSITLQIAGNTEDVLVRGDVGRPPASGKLAVPPREAVQTLEIVPRAVIEERGVTTINEAIETAVGVQPIAGYGGMDSASLISRGFANDWILRNGFRMFRFGVPVESAVVDRLEVLKGPAGLLAGQTDPGGTLNLVSKAPVAQRLFTFDSTVGAHGFFRNVLDAGGAVTGTGDRLTTRVTLAHERAGSHREDLGQNKLFLAPQIRWQITPRTSAQVELNYLRNTFDFERGLPPSAASLEVPRSRVIRDGRLDRSSSDSVAVFQSVTHELSTTWVARQALGVMSSDSRIFETYLGSADEAGDLDLYLDRSVEENVSVTVQGELQGTWRLGGRTQRTVAGVEYSRYRFGYQFYDRDGTFGPVATVNIFTPRYDYALPALETPVFGDDYGSRSVSAYVDHQAALSDRVKILGGARLDRATGFNVSRMSGEDAYPEKLDVRVSPRLGAVVTPVPSTDVFASVATSFKPNVFGTDADGESFDPETGQQIEAGVRREIVPGRWRASAAVFRIEKRNVVVYEPPAGTPGRSGTRESTGLELETSGSPRRGWTLTAGYAFVDATITEDTDPANVGARLFGSPRHQAHVWQTYDLPQGRFAGLTIGHGLFLTGERAANEPASVMLPGYVRHDLMARYRVGRLTGQVNVENLTGVDIYDTHGFFIYPRDGAAARVTVSVRF